MFWRFGFHQTSPLEAILEKESFTLLELMNEDDVIQECKSQNSKLISFLCQHESLQRLIDFIIMESSADADDTTKYKYPYVAHELLCCDVLQMYDALFESEQLVDSFFSLLCQPAPLSALLTSYFCKVCLCLLARKPMETINALQRKSLAPLLVHHLASQSVAELLSSVLLECEEQLARQQMLDEEGEEKAASCIEWVQPAVLMQCLVNTFHEELSQDVHINAAAVLCSLIRRNGAPSPCFLAHLYTTPIVTSLLSNCLALSSTSLDACLGVYLELLSLHLSSNGPLTSPVVVELLPRLPAFAALLKPSTAHTLELSAGTVVEPLGVGRLKVLELFALVAAHDRLVGIVDGLLIEVNIVPTLFEFFTHYEFNNFVHHFVYRVVIGILNRPQSSPLPRMLLDVWKIAELLCRCLRANQESKHQKCYMGHVHLLANALLSCSHPFIHDYLEANEEWTQFASYLSESNFRESQALARPAMADPDSTSSSSSGDSPRAMVAADIEGDDCVNIADDEWQARENESNSSSDEDGDRPCRSGDPLSPAELMDQDDNIVIASMDDPAANFSPYVRPADHPHNEGQADLVLEAEVAEEVEAMAALVISSATDGPNGSSVAMPAVLPPDEVDGIIEEDSAFNNFNYWKL